MSETIARLRELVDARLRAWEDAPLASLGRELALSPELGEALAGLRVELSAWAAPPPDGAAPDRSFERAPAAWMADRFTAWARRRNPFVELDAAVVEPVFRDALDELSRALERADGALVRERVRGVLERARRRLHGALTDRLGPELRDVVNAEYSAELQLELLGLDALVLAEPILDVGGGASATLVRALRERGKDARVVDLDAPDGLGDRADWLLHDYGDQRWGTVISHQALTLHFLHHHHAPRGRPEAYARTYLAILRSLRPGGLFAYAPPVPFFEAVLPMDRFSLERVPFPEERRTPALAEVSRETGLTLDHAVHVRRR